MERRSFIKVAVAAGLGSNAARALAQQSQSAEEADERAASSMLPRVKDPGELRGEMLYRLLGRTGERVSAIGLGGSHIGKPAVAAAESIRLIHQSDRSRDHLHGQLLGL